MTTQLTCGDCRLFRPYSRGPVCDYGNCGYYHRLNSSDDKCRLATGGPTLPNGQSSEWKCEPKLKR